MITARPSVRERGVPLQDWVYHQDRDNGVATFEVPTRQAIGSLPKGATCSASTVTPSSSPSSRSRRAAVSAKSSQATAETLAGHFSGN